MTTLGRYVASLRACGLRPADRVAVALSGGPDSLALAAMTALWQRLVKSQVSVKGGVPVAAARSLRLSLMLHD
jgi:PP-loop superfamily ATP-utilizing enzyme